MGNECSKAVVRRLYEPGFATRFFVGDGIDIGSGSPSLGNVDFLGNYQQQFPLMSSCTPWDIEDGDAQLMASVLDEHFDFVHSAHCLEHMRDPVEALRNWYRILRPGGHLIVVVPDEDLYEQGQWPSTYNGDHKVTFTIFKRATWSPVSYSLIDLFESLSPAPRVLKVHLLDNTFQYGCERRDQTGTIAECAIELVLQKPVNV